MQLATFCQVSIPESPTPQKPVNKLSIQGAGSTLNPSDDRPTRLTAQNACTVTV
ncbi:hypothetical protein Q5692_36165 [Microcoleus sp. C2C3]|uniref:hypothetical protein n=1 Tax=unclassified Microcoleus TaxID=2642155 RepID=UPI002FD224D2